MDKMERTDPDNPMAWSISKKLLVAFGPIMTAFVGSMTVSLYVASIPGVTMQFHLGSTLAVSPISFAALGFFLGPILAVSVSEIYGRCWVYRISLVPSIAFTIVAGTATNFRTLVTARCLASLFISPSVSVVAGVINDMWDVKTDRLGTIVMVVMASSVVWSTEIGPAASAAIVKDTSDWRWTFYLSSILLSACMITLLNPETFGPELLRRKQRRQGKLDSAGSRGSSLNLLAVSMGRALHMIVVEPIVTTTTFMSGVYQATLYCFYIAFPMAFQKVYRFTEYQVGLTFLPLLVGSVLGVPVMVIIDKYCYRPALIKAQEAGHSDVEPEKRLYTAMVGSVLMPVALFWLGWTARSSIHWIVPLMACLPLGVAIECILFGLPIYRNDVYGAKYGASSLAADNIMRYGFSIAVPLFTVQMVNGIGFDWTCSLLGCICVALLPVPWLIYRYGPWMRARSKYVSVEDHSSQPPTRLRTDLESVAARRLELRLSGHSFWSIESVETFGLEGKDEKAPL